MYGHDIKTVFALSIFFEIYPALLFQNQEEFRGTQEVTYQVLIEVESVKSEVGLYHSSSK